MKTKRKEWPDDQMLNKMWETFMGGDDQGIDWFKYAVRCELGDRPLSRINWVAFEEQLPREFAMVAQSEDIVVQVWLGAGG